MKSVLDAVSRQVATRSLADRVGEILACESGVCEVLLFGSVARLGSGKDIDLIIVAHEALAERFLRSIKILYPNYRRHERLAIYPMKTIRRNAADFAFWNGRDSPTLLQEAVSAAHPVELDIFVFPPNWRDQLDRLQTDFPNRDPEFMENIARDAIKIA
jgi:hypothetical protein